MTRTFIETTMFTRQWKDLGFLQNLIMGNPKTDDAVPGVRGKMILPSHGKEFFTSHGKHFFT